MKILRLTESGFWHEIEADKDLQPIVKDTLKGAVGAYINHTIPPTTTDYQIRLLKNDKIEEYYFELDFDLNPNIKHYAPSVLELLIFVPKDSRITRQFAFLRLISYGHLGSGKEMKLSDINV